MAIPVQEQSVLAVPPATATPQPAVPPEATPATPAAALGAGRSRQLRRRCVAALVTLDVLAIALAMGLAYALRQSVPVLGRAGDLPDAIRNGTAIIAVGWIGAIAGFGGYAVRRLASGPEIFRSVLHASLAAAGIVGAGAYLASLELSRAFFLVLFLLGPPILLLNRLLARRAVNTARVHGRFRSSVLVIGSMPYVDSIAATVDRETWLGYDVVGCLVPRGEGARVSRRGIPVLGPEDRLIEVARRLRPAVLLFAAGASADAEEFRRTAWQLEDLEVDLIVVPALSEISGDRMSMRPVAGLPLVHLDPPRARDALKLSKRAFDVLVSAAALVLASPLLLAIALTVRGADGGPVIFRQQRVGRGGQTFELWKFRSMVVDAEERLAELRGLDGDEARRGNDVMFKLADDPRITRPGRFLRRFSLDELPQLWNVLRGDMSLVGPRPALEHEVARYDQDAQRRLSVRPGITGLWQVSGRSDLSWSETVRLDMYYVDNWSFTQDVQILARTVRAVLSPSGAY